MHLPVFTIQKPAAQQLTRERKQKRTHKGRKQAHVQGQSARLQLMGPPPSTAEQLHQSGAVASARFRSEVADSGSSLTKVAGVDQTGACFQRWAAVRVLGSGSLCRTPDSGREEDTSEPTFLFSFNS